MWSAAALVFSSGFCALIYQIVWTREFRLVFGASTAASAAVVAIFIAGLGWGGLVLGRRVEKSGNPLLFYARLELGIASLSAATPWLLSAARTMYVASGGSLALGTAGATVMRLVLTGLVLGLATFLMGGTLPAVARAVQTEQDGARSSVALLYGANTLGAVCGCLLANFALLEIFGSKLTLWIACLLNALVAMSARAVARRTGAAAIPEAMREPALEPRVTEPPPAPSWLTLISAGVVGFAFFLMELVWYRMLGPLLGGTVFTFGLILTVALAGIGVGSALYTLLLSERSVRLSGFALTCLLEAALIAFPYALGDRVALWTLLLRPLGSLGFHGLVFGWALIAGVVVFPAAVVSGLQFPMLIALLGRGRAQVGRDVGRAYAANTLGAITGALAGGFGLIRALGALRCWQLAALVLCVWGAVVAIVALRSEGRKARFVWVAAAAAATLLMLVAQGPTAAWRHSPIGAGRVKAAIVESPNEARAFVAQQRRAIVWQAEGIESAVALDSSSGLAFIVNGKTDGNARRDAPTQVMAGLLGAVLQPHTRSAMVIGLGTGSTAGWLAQVPSIERVDVAEIEPAILQVAERCASVNERVLHNSKVHVFQGDARELLDVSRANYDVIFSEPSNPYRAGIASLYTREFYEAIARRLAPGGVFVQWMQAYEVDTRTIRTIYATLGSVFPSVESWHGVTPDLLLIASRQPQLHDGEQLRARLAEQPYARAMQAAWRTEGLEGLLSHYVANTAFARDAYESADGALNTDDLMLVEFGFIRGLGAGGSDFAADSLVATARDHAQQRPRMRGGHVDWPRVDFEHQAFLLMTGFATDPNRISAEYRARLDVLTKWTASDLPAALAAYRRLEPAERTQPIALERLALAEMLAYAADPEAETEIAALAHEQATEAATLQAIWLLRTHRTSAALAAFDVALKRYRKDPWPMPGTMQRALQMLAEWGTEDVSAAPAIMRMLSQPFAVYANESARGQARLRLASALGQARPACLELFSEMEPDVPWTLPILQFRAACYAAHGSALRQSAQADLDLFGASEPLPFASLVHLGTAAALPASPATKAN
jgi:spermidine synthase